MFWHVAMGLVIDHLLILGRALAKVLLLPPCSASSGLLSLCQRSLPRAQLCCPLCAGRLNSMPPLCNALGLLLSCQITLISWHGRRQSFARSICQPKLFTPMQGCHRPCCQESYSCQVSCQVRSLPCGCATASLPRCGRTPLRPRHEPWPPPALPEQPPSAPVQSPLQHSSRRQRCQSAAAFPSLAGPSRAPLPGTDTIIDVGSRFNQG